MEITLAECEAALREWESRPTPEDPTLARMVVGVVERLRRELEELRQKSAEGGT